jgi:glutathione S-transferase
LILQDLDYNKDYIDFSNKPEWLFERSEKGTVPVLDDGGKWVPDSGGIATYLSKEYPKPDLGPINLPENVGSEFLPSFAQLLKSKGQDTEKEKQFLDQLQQLDDHLRMSGKTFFNGDEMGAADCLIVR